MVVAWGVTLQLQQMQKQQGLLRREGSDERGGRLFQLAAEARAVLFRTPLLTTTLRGQW